MDDHVELLLSVVLLSVVRLVPLADVNVGMLLSVVRLVQLAVANVELLLSVVLRLVLVVVLPGVLQVPLADFSCAADPTRNYPRGTAALRRADPGTGRAAPCCDTGPPRG